MAITTKIIKLMRNEQHMPTYIIIKSSVHGSNAEDLIYGGFRPMHQHWQIYLKEFNTRISPDMNVKNFKLAANFNIVPGIGGHSNKIITAVL